MSNFIEYQLERGSTVWIEVEEQGGGLEKASRDSGSDITEKPKFKQAKSETIHPCVFGLSATACDPGSRIGKYRRASIQKTLCDSRSWGCHRSSVHWRVRWIDDCR